MRHVLLLGSPATGMHRVSYATAAAGLVAPAGGALGIISGLLRTAVATVDLAAVAMTADEHLSAAANAQKQPAGDPLSLSIAGTWTAAAMGGILPACVLGTVRGTASIRTWRFRSTPCLSCRSGRLSSRHCALDRRRNAAIVRAPRAALWICGQRKGVAHIPTSPASNSQRLL